MADYGGVVVGACQGVVGDGVVLEGGQSVFVFTVAPPLFTSLDLLPEFCNLRAEEKRGHMRRCEQHPAGQNKSFQRSRLHVKLFLSCQTELCGCFMTEAKVEAAAAPCVESIRYHQLLTLRSNDSDQSKTKAHYKWKNVGEHHKLVRLCLFHIYMI